ncbi:MAG: hypothetical protein IJ300_08280, partial [Clostridia bacterium]|nr:hypothetical protein [Clostridia bacterium]
SYFIDLLIQDIEASAEEIRVVKYNAWENDYCDNAFDPLMYDILKSEHLQFSTESDSDKDNLKNLMKNVCKVGAVFSKQIINNTAKQITGIDFEKAIDEVFNAKDDIKDFMLREIPNIAELNAQREIFKNFKKYINNATNWMKDDGIKLVVIIDELDRCKPSFAIQTLEVIKHLFDVENIVFLFAVDIEQLSHSISSIYGQGFDSVGYLCRFFDYIAKMPNPDIKVYVEEKMNELETIPDILVTSIKQNDERCRFVVALSDFMLDIYKSFDFSLRDLDTVLQSYNIMLSNFLKEYQMIGAHMIYLFYLSLKYKQPDLFHKIFVDTSSYRQSIQHEGVDFLKNTLYDNKWIHSSVDTMLKDLQFKDIKFQGMHDEVGKKYDSLNKVIKYVNSNVQFEGRGIYNDITVINRRISIFINTSLDNILFYPDIIKWDEIKHMTYREYLHKQLEMYNFVDMNEE